MKNPFAPMGSWTLKARPQEYRWQPDEVHFELWHEIIDTFGLPTWIRRHSVMEQPLTEMEEVARDQIFSDDASKRDLTTEYMCTRTHVQWVPIAYFSYPEIVGGDQDVRRTYAQNIIRYDLYGYYALDFAEKDLLVMPTRIVSERPISPFGHTLITETPKSLLL